MLISGFLTFLPRTLTLCEFGFFEEEGISCSNREHWPLPSELLHRYETHPVKYFQKWVLAPFWYGKMFASDIFGWNPAAPDSSTWNLNQPPLLLERSAKACIKGEAPVWLKMHKSYCWRSSEYKVDWYDQQTYTKVDAVTSPIHIFVERVKTSWRVSIGFWYSTDIKLALRLHW